VLPNQEFTYLGHTELESGKWAVVMRGSELQMARLDKAPEVEKGQKIVFNEIDRGTFQMKAAEQVKQQERAQNSDKDQEREL
jgi:aspartyl aminopeptidase